MLPVATIVPVPFVWPKMVRLPWVSMAAPFLFVTVRVAPSQRIRWELEEPTKKSFPLMVTSLVTTYQPLPYVTLPAAFVRTV